MRATRREKQWFDDVNVPTRSYNKSLGLKNIKVYPPTPRQQAYDIECTCVLFLVCGTITVSIAESRQGTYYIIPPGQIRSGNDYYQPVRLDYDLMGQVLKYAESVNFGREVTR